MYFMEDFLLITRRNHHLLVRSTYSRLGLHEIDSRFELSFQAALAFS